MKDFIKKNKIQLIFALVGTIGGFLYWKFVGCLSGTCPIKSVWYLSSLWGMAFGYLSGSIVRDIILKFREKKTADTSGEGN